MSTSAAAAFFALTPERILTAAEVGGRRATGRVQALGSLENRVYEIELEEGEPLVAKFYRPGRWSQEAIADEHRFLGELAAAEVPVAPPLPLPGDRTLGTLLVDGAELRYALFPKVRGRVPQELAAPELEWLGRLIARLHLVGARHPALARPALTVEHYGHHSVAVLLQDGVIPLELEGRFRRTTAALLALCAPLLDGQPRLRLHGDCHLGNLIWEREGPRFVDFDDFLAGPAVQDLWLLAPGTDDEALAGRERLARAYRTFRDFDQRTLDLVEPLRALRMLRYAAWVSRRYGDPAFGHAFPQFREHAFWQREVDLLDDQRRRIEGLRRP